MLSKLQQLALHLYVVNNRKMLTPEVLDRIKNTIATSEPHIAVLHVIKTSFCKSYSEQNAKKLIEEAQKQFKLAAQNATNIVTYFEADYPNRVKALTHNSEFLMPLALFVKGNVACLNAEHAVAVVGSRKCSTIAKTMGQKIAKDLAVSGACIVSGLAVGCDTAGHRGALESGGATVAVLAHGLDIIFPIENTLLARSIILSGALVSQYAFGSMCTAQNFKDRDALQTALSDACIVVQAENVRCGTMVTAGHCLKQQRPLFCIDPTYDRTGSYAGNLQLLNVHPQVSAIQPSHFNAKSFIECFLSAATKKVPTRSGPVQQTLTTMFAAKRARETVSHVTIASQASENSDGNANKRMRSAKRAGV